MSKLTPDVLVGQRIQKRRNELWLSQGELAERIRERGLNWSQGTLSRVELGDRPVRLTEAPHVASALEFDPLLLLQAVDLFQSTVTHYSARLKDLEKQREKLDMNLQEARNTLDAMFLLEALRTNPETKASIAVDPLTFLKLMSTVTGLGEDPETENARLEQILSLAGIDVDEILKPTKRAVNDELQRQTDTLGHVIHFNLDSEGAPLKTWVEHTSSDLHAKNLAEVFRSSFTGVDFGDYPSGRNPMSTRLVVMQNA